MLQILYMLNVRSGGIVGDQISEKGRNFLWKI
jgi:hypothetical protein